MKSTLTILFFLTILFSCRSVKRLTTKADSTVTRQSQASEKWDRETVTEYAVPQLPVFTVPPGISDSTLSAIIRAFADLRPAPAAQPYVIRTTIRDSGEKQLATKEEKDISVQEKTVEKVQTSPWIYAGIGAGAMFLLFASLIIAYKIIKSRILATIPRQL